MLERSFLSVVLVVVLALGKNIVGNGCSYSGSIQLGAERTL